MRDASDAELNLLSLNRYVKPPVLCPRDLEGTRYFVRKLS